MVLGTSGVAAGIVRAQDSTITSEVIGAGRVDYADEVGGPAIFTVQHQTAAPGTASGWHVHPGPVWILVTRGEFVYYTADGCQTVRPTGSAFVERPGDTSNVRNESSQEGELIVTLLIPAGRQPRSNVAAPTATCPQ
jgi:quercetin dioxygenase-like cupin family protein